MGPSGTVTFDGPTLWAAAVTLTFAILTGIVLSNVPQVGHLGGAIDALKNIAYVLTLPLFDLSRRVFAARRAARAAPAPSAHGPDLLRLAFVSALVLFVLVELMSVLAGFGIGTLCVTLAGQQAPGLDFGPCLVTGLSVLGNVLLGPLMLALGVTAGWIWRGTLRSGFLTTLLIFSAVVAILFALDFLIVLQQHAGPVQALQDQLTQIGAVRQVGTQVVLLGLGVTVGYGARRLWQALTRAFG